MTTSTRREAPFRAFPVIGYVRGFAGCRKCARVLQAVTCWRMCDAQLVPWESCATTGGCVCRGEHRSSAAGANDNTTPMQIRNPIGYEFASACCNWGGLYRGRAMLAPTCAYRRGCVVTARDAHPPFGGEGLVCCVRDPYEPAWHLFRRGR